MNKEQKGLQIDFVKYVNIFWKYKYWFIIVPIIVMMITGILSFSKPRLYQATTTFIPEISENFSDVSLVNIKNTKSLYPLKPSEYTNILIDMLLSNKVVSGIVEKRKLDEFWGLKNKLKAINRLKNYTQIINIRGIVHLTVFLEDSDLVYQVANDYIEFLQKLNAEMNETKAKQSSVFIKKRIDETLKKKADAEKKLEEFQKKYRIVSIEDQSKSLITSTSQLYDKLVDTDVLLKQKESFKTKNDPEVIELRAKRDELKRQLSILQNVSGDTNRDYSRFAPTLEEFPALQKEYENLLKEIELQRDIYYILSKQYENVEIEASKDSLLTVQVIDQAEKPLVPASRGTKMKMVVSFIVSFFLVILLIFFKEFIGELPKTIVDSKE